MRNIPLVPGKRPADDVQQRAVQSAIAEIQASVLNGGILSDEIETPSAANTDFFVAHKLGKSTVNYLMVTPSAAGQVYTSPTASPDPSKYVNLRCSAASVKLKLYFF